jgi:signal transduction histidine kinase
VSEEERVAALERQVANLTLMVEVSKALSSTLDLDNLLQVIIKSATELTDTEKVSILLVDKASGELRFEAVTGREREALKKIVVPRDNSIAGWVVRENELLFVRDAQHDPRFYSQVDEVTGLATRSILGVPLRFKGQVIGVLEALNKIGSDDFADEDVQILTTLAGQAAVAIENARLLAELREQDRLKSQLITDASHELRTPLTAIKGYLQLILDGAMDPDQQRASLEIAARNIDVIIRLVSDVLYLQEMATVRAERAPVDLGELIQGVVDAYQEQARLAGVTLQAGTPLGLPSVSGSQKRLARVLANLVDNAIKFNVTGGEVLVRLREEGDHLRVEVSDTGIGIPAEHLGRVFNLFYRVDSSALHLTRGVGLGLSIARQIIEEHGGEMHVESVPGEGSVFSFALPKMRVENATLH